MATWTSNNAQTRNTSDGSITLSNTQSGIRLYTGCNSLGIGKSNPSYTLDINGDLNYSGTLNSNGNNIF